MYAFMMFIREFVYFTALHFFLTNRLDVYIHDYLIKRNFHASAKAFQAEGKVSTDPVGRALHAMQFLYLLFLFLTVVIN